MRETQARCEACTGDFVKIVKIINKYLTNATTLHTAKLTVKNLAQGKEEKDR